MQIFKGENIDVLSYIPFRFGYEFIGWYLEESFENQIQDYTYFMKSVTLYAKWSRIEYSLNYYVNESLYYSTFNNEEMVPTDPKNIGFIFNGWYTNSDFDEEFLFNVNPNDDTNLYAKFTYLDSSIPFVSINTENNATISRTDYVTADVSILNIDGESDLTNLLAKVRGRGNSTWSYDKKPYRIKFDKKIGLFGMPKAKNWVLLADYLDPSSMHNFSAFSFANAFEYKPYEVLTKHVRLYLNGEYRGLYILTQNPDEKEGRLDIEQDYNEEIQYLKYSLEFDYSIASDTSAILDEDYFLQQFGQTTAYISFDYPTKDDFDDYSKFQDFVSVVKTQLNDLVDALYSGDYNLITNYIDEDSLIDYILIDQILGENDHAWKSFKFYTLGDGKFRFGPVWDYDWIMNTPWTSEPNISSGNPQITFNNIIKTLYTNTPQGKVKTAERWFYYSSSIFDNVTEIINLEMLSIIDEAYLDSELWYNSNYSLVDNNMIWLIDYINNMKILMDEYYSEYLL